MRQRAAQSRRFSQYRIKRCTRQPRSRRCKYRVQRYPRGHCLCKMASMTPVRFDRFCSNAKDRHLLLGLLEVSRQEPKKHPHPDSAKQQTQLSRLLRLAFAVPPRAWPPWSRLAFAAWRQRPKSRATTLQQHRINRAGQRELLFAVSRQCRSLVVLVSQHCGQGAGNSVRRRPTTEKVNRIPGQVNLDVDPPRVTSCSISCRIQRHGHHAVVWGSTEVFEFAARCCQCNHPFIIAELMLHHAAHEGCVHEIVFVLVIATSKDSAACPPPDNSNVNIANIRGRNCAIGRSVRFSVVAFVNLSLQGYVKSAKCSGSCSRRNL